MVCAIIRAQQRYTDSSTMGTHATAAKPWSENELDNLPVEKGVRLRGLEVTRLDTFIDAAFAFVLTLLVISFDELPSNYEEMLIAIKRIPGFAASFAVLMMFWLAHRGWSRRYGLESPRSLFLSLSIIFVVLVYVYPLRVVFEGMFWQLSGGYFTADFKIATRDELKAMFVFYSSGFFIMALLFSDLFRTALKSKDTLCLNELEVRATKRAMLDWRIYSLFGVISIILSYTLPAGLIPLAGYVYALVYPAVWLAHRIGE